MRNVRVMIVDDEPRNLDLLEDLLQCEGYQLFAFPRGDLALTAARKDPPDLVLLDIRMPGMNGFEVCGRFKEDEKLRDIPIIFLSALSDPEDKVRAFEKGGVDYITKPLNASEVLARVRAHLELRFHRMRLEELVRLRSEQLSEANRRLRVWDRAKSQWLNTISHEMRTPLNGIFGVSELLFEELKHTPIPRELKTAYETSRFRMKKLIEDAETLASIDVASDFFTMEATFLIEILQAALETAVTWDEAENIDIGTEIESASGALVLCEPRLIRRAFVDLLSIALNCVREGESILLESRVEGSNALVRIATRGEFLPPEDLETFFEIGGQRTLLREGGDFGLGPALARRILELFGGRLSVRNGDERGIVLEALLPLVGKAPITPLPCPALPTAST